MKKEVKLLSIENEVRELLINMGMPTHIKGYRYLVYAIDRTFSNPVDLYSDLYEAVAKKFNASTAKSVEKCMRDAISATDIPPYYVQEVFRGQEHIKNSKFISGVVEYIKLKGDIYA